jgi:hypothetical protein
MSTTTTSASSLNNQIVDSGIGHYHYKINDANFTNGKKEYGSRTSSLSGRPKVQKKVNTGECIG